MGTSRNRVGIYCRLSQEDRNKSRTDDDSESIKNQKLMLTEYAVSREWEIYSIYSDDDYTGTDHSRPEFNRLLKDAENGMIDIILCKSQSRFTRDMEDVEHYIHGLFPQWGVRFVSIVDNADTDIRGNKKSRQINAMVNEWYLEDMSESIKAVLTSHRKNGKFIGAFAPYGYQKDPADRSHLIPDEPAASVVRRIFSLYIQGFGKGTIAKMLNEEDIPCPSRYKNENGLGYKNQHCKGSPLWRYYSISSIIGNEVYIGNLVQNKSHSVSYKTKKKKPTGRSEWIRAEHTHEPVIDIKTWELAQTEARKRGRQESPAAAPVNIFSGKLVCGICGGSLGRHKSSRNVVDYRCNTHRYDSTKCPGTRITHRLLYGMILDSFTRHAALLADPDEIAANIGSNNDAEQYAERLRSAVAEAGAKEKQILEAQKSLLLSKVRGELSEENFRVLYDSFSDDLERCRRTTENRTAELEKLRDRKCGTDLHRQAAERYLGSGQLDKAIINLFIDRITVMPSEPYSRKAHLSVYWKF